MCGCFKLIGCCFIFFFVLITILGFTASYFFTIYLPEFPSYQVEKLEVSAWDIGPDSTLSTQILITLRAANPNTNIGFIYGENGSVNILFNGTDLLCSGTPPHFQQGRKSVSMIRVETAGKRRVGPGIQAALQSHMPVPLVVAVEIPMRIVIDDAPMREFMIHVNSLLVVDKLAPNYTANIISSDTAFHFEL